MRKGKQRADVSSLRTLAPIESELLRVSIHLKLLTVQCYHSAF